MSRAGHLPGNREDLTRAEHSCDWGSPALPPWRAEGLGSASHPRRPGLSFHLVCFQLPLGEPSTSRSELNPKPFWGWGVPPTLVCPALLALHVRLGCSLLLPCVCPGHTCVPSSLPAQH